MLRSRTLVQAVDILRDNRMEASLLFELSHRLVGAVRNCAAPVVVEDFANLRPGTFRMGVKIIQFDEFRIVFVPEPSGTAERRNSAFHGDSGSGECHSPCPLRTDQRSGGSDIF